MAKIERKYIIAGVIGVVTIAGAFLYLEYQKLMDYAFSVKKVKVRKFSAGLVSFDIFLSFVNKSGLSFVLKEQEYKVYLNDHYVTRLSNGMDNTIEAKSTSEVGVNVAFEPQTILKAIGKNWAEMLLYPEKIMVKTEMKFKIQLFGFLILTIPYTYTVSLKELKSWYV